MWIMPLIWTVMTIWIVWIFLSYIFFSLFPRLLQWIIYFFFLWNRHDNFNRKYFEYSTLERIFYLLLPLIPDIYFCCANFQLLLINLFIYYYYLFIIGLFSFYWFIYSLFIYLSVFIFLTIVSERVKTQLKTSHGREGGGTSRPSLYARVVASSTVCVASPPPSSHHCM